jgi:hypothetical protein
LLVLTASSPGVSVQRVEAQVLEEKMQRHILQIAAAVLVLAAVIPACGQQAPTITAQANTVYVSAEGRYESPPDTAVIQFNIAPQEETAKAAYDHATRAAEQVRQVLRNNGIDPKEAEIGFFSLAPVYDWRQPKRKLIAYRVTSAVTLKLKDFNKVAPIVQQLADIDVTENQTLNYTLKDMEVAKIKAVQNAYERARNEAEAVAKAGGRTLGELYYGSVDTFEQVRVFQPVQRMAPLAATASAAAAPAPTAEFTPQHIAVTARVNAMFLLK